MRINDLNSGSKTKGLWAFVFSAGLVLLLTAWIYSYGLTGTWHFDDPGNLGGLERIQDTESALAFTFTGRAGPTGRPLALATFVPQASHWPDDPEPFLEVNILIHLFNACLAFLAVYLMARAAGAQLIHSRWVAFMVGSIWTLSPFLASTHLMVIQRMTSLSGLFVLLGLILYLRGRALFETRPKTGLLLIWSAILPATCLAAFSKENGALLPSLILLIEILFRSQGAWKMARSRLLAIFAVATISIVNFGYILYRGLTSPLYEFRNFDLTERLLTQSRVIWDYILNLMLPRATVGNAFNDDFLISSGLLTPLSTLFAVVALMALICTIVFLARKMPLVAFGLSFFLVAHLVESTVLPLEIYFPHRNYIPALGLYLAVAAAIMHAAVATSQSKLVIFGGLSYAAVMAFSLFTVTHMWGNPAISASHWLAQNPSSIRAAEYLASRQFDAGEYYSTIETWDRAHAANPDDIYILTQSLQFCDVERDGIEDHLDKLFELLSTTETIKYNEAAGLHGLVIRIDKESCPQITPVTVARLVDQAHSPGKRFQNSDTEYRLIYARAQLAATDADLTAANEFLEQALALDRAPDAITVIRIAYNLVLMGRMEDAIARLDQALSRKPRNFFRRLNWQKRISEYREALASGQTDTKPPAVDSMETIE